MVYPRLVLVVACRAPVTSQAFCACALFRFHIHTHEVLLVFRGNHQHAPVLQSHVLVSRSLLACDEYVAPPVFLLAWVVIRVMAFARPSLPWPRTDESRHIWRRRLQGRVPINARTHTVYSISTPRKMGGGGTASTRTVIHSFILCVMIYGKQLTRSFSLVDVGTLFLRASPPACCVCIFV